MPRPDLSLEIQNWPYRRPIAISRGVLEKQTVLHATARDGPFHAQGEGEQHESDVSAAAVALDRGHAVLGWLADAPDRTAMRARLPADGLRNALDAMLWDLECKRTGLRAWELAGLRQVDSTTRVRSMYTVTLDDPEAMAQQARAWRDPAVLKVKLGERAAGGLDRDIERLHAVAQASPGSALTVDPNEAWTAADLCRFVAATRTLPLALVEQPMRAGQEDLLPALDIGVAIAADEACTALESLARLAGRVQYVNLKLDKCGGLTEALMMCEEARRLGLKLMVGCNCGTSLAIAPAFLVATQCEFVDLDGPLHMRDDRYPAIRYDAGLLHAPDAALWG